MQFSNTTSKNGIVQLAEFGLGLPDGSISGNSYNLAIFTQLTNTVQYDLLTAILRGVDGWDFDDKTFITDQGISTTPLQANKRSYTFPTNLVNVKRLDVSYNASSPTDTSAIWYRCNPIDSTELSVGVGNDTTVDGLFSQTAPRYDAKNNTIMLYPRLTTGTGYMRLEFTRELDDFETSDTGKEPGIDEAFHDLVVTGVKLKWAVAKNMKNAKDLKVLYDEGIAALQSYYGDKIEDEGLAITGNMQYGEYR